MASIFMRLKQAVSKALHREPPPLLLVDLFSEAIEEVHDHARDLVQKNQHLNKERIEKLQRLGFEEAEEVSEYRKLQPILAKAVENANRIHKYNERYPQYKFIPFDSVLHLCMENNLVCIPFKFLHNNRMPDEALDQITAFTVEQRDIWFSNYPGNIIEFNQKEDTIRLSLAEAIQQEGKDPGGVCGLLQRMPLYIVQRTRTIVNPHTLYSENDNSEAMVLHPVPNGFLIVTGWSRH